MRLTLVRSSDRLAAARAAVVARVNLLPEAARTRVAARIRTRLWCGAIIAAVALVLISWRIGARSSTQLEAARRQLAGVQRQIHEEARRAAGLAALLTSARERRALLTGVCATDTWAPHLAQVALAVPENVYLTQVAIDATQKPSPTPVAAPATRGQTPPAGAPASPPPSPPPPLRELRIAGVALDHGAVTTLLTNLQQAGCFKTVELTRSAAAGSGPGRVLEFAIVCRR